MPEQDKPLMRRAVLGGLGTLGVLTGTVGAGLTPLAARAEAATPSGLIPLRVFAVEHPGAGAPADETSIQDALDAARRAGGGQVTVGPGTWSIARNPLRIYANTRLTLTPATTLVRTGAVSAMLSNGPRDGSDRTTKAYDGPGNIVVEGGVWNANGHQVRSPAWGLVFAHARGITVRDLEIRDVPDWHAIEFNSTYDGTVTRCRFDGSITIDEPEWNEEAVSIDLAMTGLPPYGADDNTPSRLIRVTDNHCENWQTFCGCHSAVDSTYHDQLVVTGNVMRNLSWWGIDLKNAWNSIVANNTMTSVGGGIWIRSDTAAGRVRPVRGVIVANNVIDTLTIDEGIRLAGTTTSTADGSLYGVSVSGNVVRGAVKNGILAQHAPGACVTGNSIDGSTGAGVRIEDSDRVRLTGNGVQSTTTEGIHVLRSADAVVTDNALVDTALAADTSHDAIRLDAVHRASLQGNKIVATGDRRPAHAIGSDAASSEIFFTCNDVRGGYGDAAFALQGSGHTDRPGNIG